jgi:hypothetical protein
VTDATHDALILRGPSAARASRRMAAGSELAAMVRDGALRAPPHHEAGVG